MYSSLDTSDIIGTICLKDWDCSTPAKLHDQYITSVWIIADDRAALTVSDYPVWHNEQSRIIHVWPYISIDLVKE